MRAPTRRHSATIKFRAVLDLLRGERSLAQVAQVYQVPPNALKVWKDWFLERGSEIFEREFPDQGAQRANGERAGAQALGVGTPVVGDERSVSGSLLDWQAPSLSALLRRQAE